MNLCKEFIESLHRQLSVTEADALVYALANTPPSVSARANTLRDGVVPPAEARKVAWMPEGFYCLGRPAFTFDPLLHAGHYYVQDASSMFIGHVLRTLTSPLSAVRYLDLCAAPGGKTTTALQTLPAGSIVVANDYVSGRAQVLATNVQRWGQAHTVVTNASAEQYGALFPEWFDVVAADVPCSGEGMMRKDAEAAAQWSAELVQQCAHRQQQIVDDVWPALRPGGLFIYSTCTFNRHENEHIVEHLMQRHGAVPITVDGIDPSWCIAPALNAPWPAYRFFPHRVAGEGLFLAVLRKPDDKTSATSVATFAAKPTRRTAATSPSLAAAADWLATPAEFTLRSDAATTVIEAIPQEMATIVDALRRTPIRVLHAGVPLATLSKGGKIIPHPALAWALQRRDGAFNEAELTYREAIAYLRGETLRINAPVGIVLLTYHGAALGFANNIGSRSNNLYPKSLRILSTHVPNSPTAVLTT